MFCSKFYKDCLRVRTEAERPITKLLQESRWEMMVAWARLVVERGKIVIFWIYFEDIANKFC